MKKARTFPYKTYGAYKKRAEKLNITIEDYLGEMLYVAEEKCLPV